MNNNNRKTKMHDLEAPLNAQTPLVPPGGACAASLMNEGPLGGPSISLSSSPQHPQQQPQQQQQQELRHPQQQQQEYEEEESGLQYQHEAVDVAAPSVYAQTVPRAPYPRPYDSLWRLLFLLLIAAGPFIGMLLFLSLLKNVGAAMLFMHWVCMVGAPAVYIHFASDGWSYCKHVYLCQGPGGGRWGKQGIWACACLLLGAVGVYAGFKFIWVIVKEAAGVDLQKDMQQRLQDMGMGGPLWVLVLLSVYFIIFNPIIEEVFWRVFLYREIGAGLFGSAAAGLLYIKEAQPLTYKIHQAWRVVARGPSIGGGGDEPQHQANAVAAAPQHPTTAAATAEAVEAAAAAAAAKEIGDANEAATTAAAAPLTQSHEESVSGSPAAAAPAPEPAAATGAAGAAGSGARSSSTRSIAYYDLKVPLTGLLALAAAYSSYHMVVIHSLMGPAYVLPAFFAISLLGAVLLYLRNKERFGLLTATGLHAGVDVGVVFVLAELLGIF